MLYPLPPELRVRFRPFLGHLVQLVVGEDAIGSADKIHLTSGGHVNS